MIVTDSSRGRPFPELNRQSCNSPCPLSRRGRRPRGPSISSASSAASPPVVIEIDTSPPHRVTRRAARLSWPRRWKPSGFFLDRPRGLRPRGARRFLFSWIAARALRADSRRARHGRHGHHWRGLLLLLLLPLPIIYIFI